jgi:hypothetical protein
MREIEFGFYATIPVERMSGIQGVDDVHDLFVFFGNARRTVVEA